MNLQLHPVCWSLAVSCTKQALPSCLAHQYQGSMGTSVDSMQLHVPKSYSRVIGLDCSLAREYKNWPSLACFPAVMF